MIPKGWQEKSISELLEKISKPVEVEPDCFYREIGIRSHGKGIFHKDPVMGKILGNKRVFHVEPDCFVVNIVFAWEQAVAKTSSNEVGMIASHRFPMYRARKDRCDVEYILYLFNTKYGKHILELASPGGAGRNKTLGQSEFSRLQLIIPPANEQKKIAQILSTWDKAITATEQLLTNSQQQKKALMQQLLTGKKRFPGFSGEWKKQRLSNLVTINYGKSPKEINSTTGSYLILGTGGVIGKTDTAMCSEKSVLIGRKGTIDKPLFIETPFWAIDTTFYCLAKGSVNIKWFFYSVSSINLRSYSEASGVPSLSRETLYSILLLIPPTLEEQQKIASVLSVVDHEIEALQQKLECLKQEKKALMQQLLAGKRRVQIN
ncbi:restriction endonuclease subunit S [Nitrosomonas sp. Nm33]|uniref:restriction endonuclease subunit S n=1 Tax=Nitrosomonas sp. Nm33 TaxID=133724 RepID=UPI0008961269|nr:restriction endonuclease subunit S [Nitrosomonas sp. Nm33]SDY75125.1 type I restriction enzyme, S subunit [Nitrosomonas sp. Nm33]